MFEFNTHTHDIIFNIIIREGMLNNMCSRACVGCLLLSVSSPKFKHDIPFKKLYAFNLSQFLCVHI